MSNYLPLSQIKLLAKQEGFCDCGAAKVEKIDISSFKCWLAKGYNANMQYMKNYIDKREDISLLLQDSKTIFCFLMSYNDEDITKNSVFHIASYAQRKDYHYTIKEKLRQIILILQKQYPNLQAIAYVDTAPIMEREWAVKCGLGWIGKNSILTTKQFGNKVFIGEIICNYYSDYAQKMKNSCGLCHRCIDICPNNAIKDDKTIDCNLCISYQTIENKDNASDNIDLKNYIYGCDLCLNACIWNNKAKKKDNEDNDVKNLVCNMLCKLKENTITKEDFQLLRKQSPMNRIKYEKILSNYSLANKQVTKTKK